MYIGLHVKYRLLLSDFDEIKLSQHIFEKILECQISWKSNQLEPCGRIYGRTGG